MALRLTIISDQGAGLGERATMLVDKAAIRIGRAADNEWVLPDSQRFISAHHARISYRDGAYIVEDTSTNGLYLNDELEPVGRLGPQPLRPGDTLRMGAYRINVRDSDAPAPEASAIVSYGVPGNGHDSGEPQRDIGADLNISSLLISDPDQSAARRAYDPWGNPVSDPGLLQFDNEQSAVTRSPRAATPAPAPAPLPTRATGAAAAGAFEAFCRGAGVDSKPLPADGQERLLQLAGLLLRESLVGIKELARAQRAIRQDSGLRAAADDPERLALQNLPVEELLVRLLRGHDQRELDAVQWLRELFGFASRHDAALMRALRPALLEFTQRLDPASLTPGASAVERFRSITGMAEGQLPHLFIESLARSFNAEISGVKDED
jgi:predicted component of type VI protein secretion system